LPGIIQTMISPAG